MPNLQWVSTMEYIGTYFWIFMHRIGLKGTHMNKRQLIYRHVPLCVQIRTASEVNEEAPNANWHQRERAIWSKAVSWHPGTANVYHFDCEFQQPGPCMKKHRIKFNTVLKLGGGGSRNWTSGGTDGLNLLCTSPLGMKHSQLLARLSPLLRLCLKQREFRNYFH